MDEEALEGVGRRDVVDKLVEESWLVEDDDAIDWLESSEVRVRLGVV